MIMGQFFGCIIVFCFIFCARRARASMCVCVCVCAGRWTETEMSERCDQGRSDIDHVCHWGANVVVHCSSGRNPKLATR